MGLLVGRRGYKSSEACIGAAKLLTRTTHDAVSGVGRWKPTGRDAQDLCAQMVVLQAAVGASSVSEGKFADGLLDLVSLQTSSHGTQSLLVAIVLWKMTSFNASSTSASVTATSCKDP